MRNSFAKTTEEIENIKKACKISDAAFSFILKEIKVGISEKKLARKLTKYLKTHSDGISFRTIVAFGKNTSHVHHKPTERRLRKNNIIMLDFGAKIDGCCSDLSRTIFFGKITPKQKKVYRAVLEAQGKAIKYLGSKIMNHESVRGFEVDKAARNYILKQGFPNIPHGMGHSIGKKVHQSPRLSPKSKYYLKENMVFTIEPAIYLKDFGIRIEDVVLITKTGIKVLTKSLKKSPP